MLSGSSVQSTISEEKKTESSENKTIKTDSEKKSSESVSIISGSPN